MAKNEAAHVGRFLETTRGADVVVVTDTGSTDGTADLLRDGGVEVHSARIVPWRFDTASNVALAHVGDDVDVCVKLDLDEVLVTNDGSPWREEIERLWQGGVNRLRYWYTWSWHVPGKVPAVRFRTENIHARAGFVWRHPGHAALCSSGRGGRTAESSTLEIHHYMSPKPRPDYLPLLELAVQENRCPRTLFYLGRECFFRQLNQRAIETLEEYLAHREARWAAERAEALRMIGLCWSRLERSDSADGGKSLIAPRSNDGPRSGPRLSADSAIAEGNEASHGRSLAYLLRAIAECPGVRDLWFEVLRYFHDRGDWLGGLWAGGQCLALNQRQGEFSGGDGAAWSEQPLVLTARCAWHGGRTDEAVRLIREVLAAWPQSEIAKTLARQMIPPTER